MTVKRKHLVANFEARSVALLASWTLAGAALAQTSPPPPPSRDDRAVSALFREAGQNGHSEISRRETVGVPGPAAAVDSGDPNRRDGLSTDSVDQDPRG